MTNTAEVQPNHWRTTRKVVTQATRVLSYLVYLYLLAVEVILLLGFLLLLFGANTSAGFTEWVYRSMDRAMKPFRGIFTPIELGTTAGNEIQSVFETSVLFRDDRLRSRRYCDLLVHRVVDPPNRSDRA